MHKILILLIILPMFLFGQQYNYVTTATDSFYVLYSIDTLNIPEGLPDGKWKVFYNNDSTRPQYVFYLLDNKVNGFFISFNPFGALASMGNYYNDSLWTFRSDNLWPLWSDDLGDNDTTFKVGLWHYSIGEFSYNRLHRIPFGKNDTVYTDNWYYLSGQLHSQRVYHKANGLVEETRFFKNGDKASFFEKHSNYSINTTWTKDKRVSNLILYQDLYHKLELDIRSSIWICDSCVEQTIFDSDWNFIASVYMYNNGKIKSFNGGGVYLNYDNDGNVKRISYINKKGRYKFRKLK